MFLMPKSILLLLTMAALAMAAEESGEAPVVAKLRLDYDKSKLANISALNKTYASQVDLVFKGMMSAGDLKNATLASAFSKRLSDTEIGNDVQDIPEKPEPSDRLGVLQARYLKERGETIRRLNASYVSQIKTVQVRATGSNDIKAANDAAAFLQEIAPDGIVAATDSGARNAFLSPVNFGKWKAGKDWKIRPEKLSGGDGSATYQDKLEVPFILHFNMKILSGMRPGVSFGPFDFRNYSTAEPILLLHPSRGASQPFKYEYNKNYNIAILVSDKKCELFVDKKLMSMTDGVTKPIEKISFSAGDGWSKGQIEFRDIVVTR
jgi:hypothetical protein